jgi:hypothetical protein
VSIRAACCAPSTCTSSAVLPCPAFCWSPLLPAWGQLPALTALHFTAMCGTITSHACLAPHCTALPARVHDFSRRQPWGSGGRGGCGQGGCGAGGAA